jgi:Transglycosylase SLT domain
MVAREGVVAGLVFTTLTGAAAGVMHAQHKQHRKLGDDGDAMIPAAATVEGSQAAAMNQAREVANTEGYSAAEFQCLSDIVEQESEWNPQATNASSGAYGLFQALPGSKMASINTDWRTNVKTQAQWGIKYVKERYGTACAALSFKKSHGWY